MKALVQRDRLLHFDATTVKRTRVIDDEVDYFVSEGGGGGAALWLDPQTRARVARRVEELRAQRRALRSQAATALTINFANMTVSEEVALAFALWLLTQPLCVPFPFPFSFSILALRRFFPPRKI